MYPSNCTSLLQTNLILRSKHVTALVKDRPEKLRTVVDPLLDFTEVSIINLALFKPVCLITNNNTSSFSQWVELILAVADVTDTLCYGRPPLYT